MKAFQCTNCNNPLYFDNVFCEKCNWNVGYLLSKNQMIALKPNNLIWKEKKQCLSCGGNDDACEECNPDKKTFSFQSQMASFNTISQTLGEKGHSPKYRYCANHKQGVCNWILLESDKSEHCEACKLNRTIPNNLEDEKTHTNWELLEDAKHRLVFQLNKLKLPTKSKLTSPESGLCFDFVSNENIPKGEALKMTGHANGVITILLSEADPVKRERTRALLEERYRTVIGHFRHEVGHYYWERIIFKKKRNLKTFRALFGDERQSYKDALTTYYKNGAPSNWSDNFISKYASAHPWEDWAETWAHYLHLMDTLETAFYFGIRLDSKPESVNRPEAQPIIDPYKEENFDTIIESCVPLYLALNSLNRSMGIKDIYPFVMNDSVIKKLNYIHDTIRSFTKQK